MKRPLYVFSFLFFLAVAFTLFLPAQSGRGTIDGLVTDSTGAVIPGAEVTITSKGTGTQYTAITTESGVYRAPYLPPGTYRVTAALPGFKTAVADNVTVRLAQVLTVDLVLEVGEITEEVIVSSEGPLLETSSAEIGTNVAAKEIAAWPIFVGDGTRQLQDFIFRAMPGTQGGTFAGAINGGQAYSHEILIEGITIGRMDLNGGSNNEFTPTMDAVSEFKLQTGALSAQYGATQTALNNFGMKSGDNEYHGTVFWFHQNSALNANSWNNNRRGIKPSPNRLNNFGASGGGPVLKDRTHFFVSYEGNRVTNYTAGGNREDLATGAMKSGNFSELFNPAFTLDDRSGKVVGQDALGRDVIFGQIYDPRTSRQLDDGSWIRDPFPNNQIDSSLFSSVTRAMLAGHDLPDAQDNLLRYNYDSVSGCCPVQQINNMSVKIDHVLTDAHKISGTFVYNDRWRSRFGEGSTPAIPLDFPGPALWGSKLQATPGHIFRLTEDWTINPTILNHFALGYNRFQNSNDAYSWLAAYNGEVDWIDELGLKTGVQGQTFPVSQFQAHAEVLGSFYGQWGQSGNGGSPTGSTVISDDLSWLKGNHNLRMGIEFRKYYHNDWFFQENGTYRFHSENTSQPGFINETGFSVASWLLGEVFSSSMNIRNTNQGKLSKLVAPYIQDDWKVTPNFTLNLGLRWDIPTPMYEKYGRMSSLVPTMPNPGADGYPGALGFLSGPGERWASTYYKQLAPRIGFAWSPSSTMVVRGGYGINYAPAIMDGWFTTYSTGFNGSNNIIERPNLDFREEAAYSWDTQYPAYTGTLPNPDPAQLNGDYISWYRPELNKQPRVQNWNIGVQFDAGWDTRLEINYVGNHGDFLMEASYLGAQNQVPSQNLSLGDTLIEDVALHPEYIPYRGFEGTVGEALKPFPQFYGVESSRSNAGWSNYNSLQVQATKRSSFGLSFLTSYTWSKTLATGDTAGPGEGYYTSQDFYNRKADYGVTHFHYPHDLKLTFVYDIPLGPQGNYLTSGPAAIIMGGWQISSIMRLRSGAPLAVSVGGYVTDALFNPGIRSNQLSDDQTVSRGELDPVNGTQYLNASAFGKPGKTANNVPLAFGNTPRWLTKTRAFALTDADVSLIKRTDLGFREGANLEIRFDMLNFFNHPRWNNPNTNLDSANFGKVFTKGGQRSIQAGLRVTF